MARITGGSNNFWDLFDYSIEQAFNVSQNTCIVIIGDQNVDLLRERNHRLNEIASFYEFKKFYSRTDSYGITFRSNICFKL